MHNLFLFPALLFPYYLLSFSIHNLLTHFVYCVHLSTQYQFLKSNGFVCFLHGCIQELRGVLETLLGEGNGTPLQYSCLENPMAGGAWWAAVHGVAESDTTEQLHFSLSCIGEGNGNPLQCSCLENPRDGGPWWAAVYGVAQSRTRLR